MGQIVCRDCDPSHSTQMRVMAQEKAIGSSMSQPASFPGKQGKFGVFFLAQSGDKYERPELEQ